MSASASRDGAGRLHVSLVNLDPNRPAEISATLAGAGIKTVTGEVLTSAAMNAMNTFDQPNTVKPVPFKEYKLESSRLLVSIPPKSVVVLELR